MSEALQMVLARADIWKAGKGLQNKDIPAINSGFLALDRALPFGGWPMGALSELLTVEPGQGEMQLLLPALARISQQQWVMLIAPPYIPYAPMLAQAGVNLANVLLIHPKNDQDALWAMEQALSAGCCGAVLAWPKRIGRTSMRRLQLAAETGESMAVLLRSGDQVKHNSPATLRIAVSADAAWVKLDVVKCRGGVAPMQLRLPLSSAPFVQYAHSLQTPSTPLQAVQNTGVKHSEPTQLALPLDMARRVNRSRRRRSSTVMSVVA